MVLIILNFEMEFRNILDETIAWLKNMPFVISDEDLDVILLATLTTQIAPIDESFLC